MKIPRLIGTLRLLPLPGSPRAYGEHPVNALQTAGARAIEEAEALAQAGFDGVLIENFGDAPYYKSQLPPESIASLAVIAGAVREAVDIQVGINALRNDVRSSLAIAAVTGCDFIRANVFSGVVATDQGLVEGDAAFLLRERERLGASVAILADVHVQHGVTLSSFDIVHAIEEIAYRSLADGVVVSGRTMGRSIEPQVLEMARKTSSEIQIPLYLGGGIWRDQVGGLRNRVDGLILGSAIRKDNIPDGKIDPQAAKEIVRAFIKKSGKKRKLKK